jgi:hypothetical protein
VSSIHIAVLSYITYILQVCDEARAIRSWLIKLARHAAVNIFEPLNIPASAFSSKRTEQHPRLAPFFKFDAGGEFSKFAPILYPESVRKAGKRYDNQLFMAKEIPYVF